MSSNAILIQQIRDRAVHYLDGEKRDEKVLEAMLQTDRINFIPPQYQNETYYDDPVPIGYNQTCSQPSMVAFMMDKLEIKKANTILEIGSGCGYAAAIASILSGPKGRVFACEIVTELAEMMKITLKNYSQNIQILDGDGSAGFPNYAPFDRILISAGADRHSFKEEILLNQLKPDGILLYPETWGNIYKLKKIKDGIQKTIFYGVRFVPLKGVNS